MATFQLVKGDIITRIEPIVTMELTIDSLAERLEVLLAWKLMKLVKPDIDRLSTMVVYTALITKDACLHVVQIVLLALFVSRIVAFQLELLCLEIVAGIELIADGQRYDVQLTKVTTHGQHLQHGILRMVAGVLGATFALGYPDVLAFLGYGIMDIAAHEL